MKILCLCPTYGRPIHLLENTLASFQAQTHEDKHLLICDDLGNLEHTKVDDDRVTIVSRKERFKSLPEKYNWMWRNHPADAYCVWEDDDLYLPWHLEANHRVLEEFDFSYPSYIFSTMGGRLRKSPTAGLYHASLAFRRETLEKADGWIDIPNADFDLRFIKLLQRNFIWGDASYFGNDPTYCYRWEETMAIHGQECMYVKDDPDWYERYTPGNTDPIAEINPRFDAPSQRVLNHLEDNARFKRKQKSKTKSHTKPNQKQLSKPSRFVENWVWKKT